MKKHSTELPHGSDLEHRAAVEIERLERENAVLRSDIDSALGIIEKRVAGVIKRLERENVFLRSALSSALGIIEKRVAGAGTNNWVRGMRRKLSSDKRDSGKADG